MVTHRGYTGVTKVASVAHGLSYGKLQKGEGQAGWGRIARGLVGSQGPSGFCQGGLEGQGIRRNGRVS